MNQHLRNLWLWLTGFRRFGEIRFKPGWSNDWRWWLLYAIDYGAACLLLGIGVQPVSRWAGERTAHQPWRWLARALNAADDGPTHPCDCHTCETFRRALAVVEQIEQMPEPLESVWLHDSAGQQYESRIPSWGLFQWVESLREMVR